MGILIQDVGYALRQLRKTPGFTITALLTLALGIGANSAIFTLVNAILLHHLPVADPKTFVSLRDRSSSIHETTAPMVPELFLKAFPNCILSGDTPEQREAQERLRPVLPGPVQKLEPN